LVSRRGSTKALGIITKALPAPADTIRITIPKIASADDASRALAAVCEAAAKGELGLAQADAVSAIIARTGEQFARSHDIAELYQRVAELQEIARQRDTEPARDPAHPLPWE
jgi:hypothetical protein